MIDNIALGLSTALLAQNVFYCFVGALIGTLIGVLPGVGPTATIAMLLPLTFALPPEASLIMLAGIYYGAQYGGSTTAILVNVPGESSSAVTALDGYAMSRAGRPGPALAVAAIGSFFAGTVATLLIALFAPTLGSFALLFNSADYFALMVTGLVFSVALARGSLLKAVAVVCLGLLVGLVGTDVYTASQRLTFNIPELADGLNFVAVAVGLFGVAEVLRNLEEEHRRDIQPRRLGSIVPTPEEFKRSVMPVVRGTAIGSVLGMLPGGGTVLASFASYTVEKKLSRNPSRFGTGEIEGVAGPESANNAAAQTSFVPMLTLGLPATPIMALMIGAMIIQGIVPGPQVISREPTLFWGLIASMWVGNAMLLVLNLPLIGVWVSMLRIPYTILFPLILIFSSIGVYSVNMSAVDLYLVAAFGIGGYVFIRLGFEPAPFLLGFVLGPLLEEHLRRAMLFSRGDPTVFFTRPISLTLLLVALALLALTILPTLRRRREQIFVDD